MRPIQKHQQSVRAAIKAAGGVSKWARRFAIARSSIYDWIKKGAVPPDRAVVMERESQGLATRVELRPGDYWEWWPDLARPDSFGDSEVLDQDSPRNAA